MHRSALGQVVSNCYLLSNTHLNMTAIADILTAHNNVTFECEL